MKKCAIFLFVLSLFVSCGKQYENPNFIDINGRVYTLHSAFYQDHGTFLDNNDELYRVYYIQLQSGERDNFFPETSFGFMINSWSTTSIADGIYGYNDMIGGFQEVFLGVNQKYDAKGSVIAGEFFTKLDPSYSNTIKIYPTRDRNKKVFEISLRFIKGSQTYDVTGYYEYTIAEREIIMTSY
ncbi:MAG: hypothetical protein LBU90_05625 [Bacteroidales bacterium]|nr:hypothetical protein [Bacteroidales bacterium]